MEHIMSSYSFSHQFYKHWTQAPKLVRAAIVQELTDINKLLQPDTELADFSFNEPDLDAHIKVLYDAHYAELSAAKAIADAQQLADEQRLAEEIEKEENRKAEEKKAQEKKDAEVKVEVQDNHTISNDKDTDRQQQEKQNTLNDSSGIAEVTENTTKTGPSKGHVNSNKDKVLSALQLHASADTAKHTPITDTLVKTPILSKDNEAFIHELGMHIDDYLSEQMAQLSEDLKSWLRAEISRQLSEQATLSDSSNNQ